MVGPTGGGAGDDSPPLPPPEQAAAALAASLEAQVAIATPVVATSNGDGRRRLSPAVRRLAREHDVDLSLITGTGMGGRITRDDVLKHLETRATGSSLSELVEGLAAAAGRDPATEGDEEHIPLTPVRRMIAEAMVRSVSQIPHAWSMVEVDVTGLVAARAAMRPSFRQREGVDLTYLPFILQALVETLKENPTFNATWGGDKIILKNRLNIGLAVAAPNGLVVPVIHNADRLSLSGLAHAVADLDPAGSGQQADPGRRAGRHLHPEQHRRPGFRRLPAHHQLPPGRHHDHRGGAEAPRHHQRCHRHPVDDEPVHVLRPPHQRRRRIQRLHAVHQAPAGSHRSGGVKAFPASSSRTFREEGDAPR